MGIVICKIHGKVGIKPFIDMEITNNIKLENQGLFFKKEKKIFVVTSQYIIDEFEEMESFKIKYYISEKNMNKYKLDDFYMLTTDEDEDKFNKIIPELSGVCGKCFTEYIKKYNIEIIEHIEDLESDKRV